LLNKLAYDFSPISICKSNVYLFVFVRVSIPSSDFGTP
jgi:hypothetical protein